MSVQPPEPPGPEQPPTPPGGPPPAPPSTPPLSPPPGPPPPSSPPPSSPPPGPASPPGGDYGAPPAGAGYQGPPPQSGYGPPPGGMGGGQLSQQDERTWGMLAHISAILAAIVGLSFLGPLIVMLVQGPKSPFVRRQSVEALNFQITTYIAAFISFILVFVLIGIVLLIVVGIGWLVLTIMAGIAANRGDDYRYPVNIRLIS